ncbi:NADH-cytochrome b-5 reductase [Dipodascopsis uninucleata]
MISHIFKTSASRLISNPFALGTSAALVGTSLYFYHAMSEPIAAASPALHGEFVDLKLSKAKILNHNTGIFTFDFPNPSDESGLIIASAILIKFTDPETGKNVIRPYTPISDVTVKGHLDLLVKKYPEGKASVHIHSLKPGDTLSVKGPIIKYPWTANKHKEIVLVGGGTGITPLYQVIHEIAKNPADKTKVTLVYGNVSEDDILLRSELDAVAKSRPDQFKVVYALDKPPANWTGVSGFITKDVLTKFLPPASADNVKVFVCGPPGLYNAVSGNKVSPQDQGEVSGILKDLGFSKEQVFKF